VDDRTLGAAAEQVHPRPPARPELLRHVLDAAILASSPYNCQPWRFEAHADELHVIHPHRALLPHDIDDHATLISFGGALENIVISAGEQAHSPNIEYFPESENPYFVARLTFLPTHGPTADPMADAIRRRRTTRAPFARRRLDAETVAAVEATVASEPSLRLHVIDAPFAKRELSDLLIQAERALWRNPTTRRALLDRMASGDMPPELVVASRWRQLLVRLLLGRRWRHKVNAHFLLRNVTRRKILLRTSHVAAISLEECAPRAYIDAGRAIQRMWLGLTCRTAAVEPLCDIIGLMMVYNLKVSSFLTERQSQGVRDLTEDFNRLFRLPFGRTAVYLFRIGWPSSETPAAPSPRRPLVDFLGPNLRELLADDQAG
jgi:nitroreductase